VINPFTAYLSFETVEINARVKFTLGDLGEPFIIKTDNGNGSVLPNKDISLQMECRAQYPVEWVFDADDVRRSTAAHGADFLFKKKYF